MVNQWRGEWTEEKGYSTYPKGKWCDYDQLHGLESRNMSQKHQWKT